jgi:hypothetical protein
MCFGFLLWFRGEFFGMGGVVVWFVVFGVMIFLLFMCLLVISSGCIVYILGWGFVCLRCACFL